MAARHDETSLVPYECKKRKMETTDTLDQSLSMNELLEESNLSLAKRFLAERESRIFFKGKYSESMIDMATLVHVECDAVVQNTELLIANTELVQENARIVGENAMKNSEMVQENARLVRENAKLVQDNKATSFKEVMRCVHKKERLIKEQLNTLRYCDAFGMHPTRGERECLVSMSAISKTDSVLMMVSNCGCNIMVKANTECSTLLQEKFKATQKKKKFFKCLTCQFSVKKMITCTAAQAENHFIWLDLEKSIKCDTLSVITARHEEYVEKKLLDQKAVNDAPLHVEIEALKLEILQLQELRRNSF
jgi:hypothetical protein